MENSKTKTTTGKLKLSDVCLFIQIIWGQLIISLEMWKQCKWYDLQKLGGIPFQTAT